MRGFMVVSLSSRRRSDASSVAWTCLLSVHHNSDRLPLILVVVVVLVLEAARFIADMFEYEDEDRSAEDEDDLSF